MLARRRGFIKVALRTGASLVPVFCFSENNTLRWVGEAAECVCVWAGVSQRVLPAPISHWRPARPPAPHPHLPPLVPRRRTANQLPPTSPLRRFQRAMSRTFGFTFPIFWGTGFVLPWGLLPYPVPLNVVVGAPLAVPQWQGEPACVVSWGLRAVKSSLPPRTTGSSCTRP